MMCRNTGTFGIRALFVLCTLALIAYCNGDPAPGNVIQLTTGDFEQRVSTGTWLVKFYAPWCGHCKKLAPIWEELANHFVKAKLPVQVAKINCDDNSGPCSSAGVSGYPTIKYYVDGIQKSYIGGRKKQDFISFIDKMNKPLVNELKKADFDKILKQENPAFLLVAENPSSEIMDIFVQTAKNLLDVVSPDFYELKNREAGNDAFSVGDLPENSIVVIKQGNKFVYQGTPDLTSLLAWAKHQQFPYVTSFNEGTYEILTSSGKLLVVAVTDPVDPQQKKFLEIFKQVAKTRPDNGRYLFTTVNGREYDRWISNYGIKPSDFPAFMVWDQPNELHYLDLSAKYDTPEKINAFLDDVEAGKVPGQTWSMNAYYQRKLAKGIDWIWAKVHGHVVLYAISFCALVLSSSLLCIFCGRDKPEPESQPDKTD